MYHWKCEYCKQEFDFEKAYQSGAHKTNCKLNPKKEEIHDKIVAKKGTLRAKDRVYKDYKLVCNKCKKEYTLNLNQKEFADKKYRKHCSLKCANTRDHTQETKEKIRIAVTGTRFNFKIGSTSKISYSNCELCNKLIVSRYGNRFCSKHCRQTYIGAIGAKASVLKQNRRSKNEIYFAELCEKHFNKVLTNEAIFNGWDADVIIEDIKVAVLWNGPWHYRKLTKKHSLEQVQNRDRIKIKEIEKCGYFPYVIKDDVGKTGKRFVEEQFDILIAGRHRVSARPHKPSSMSEAVSEPAIKF